MVINYFVTTDTYLWAKADVPGFLRDNDFHFERESIKSNIVATKENRKQENLVSLNRGLSYSNAICKY